MNQGSGANSKAAGMVAPTPVQVYDNAIAAGEVLEDEAQAQVVELLDDLHRQLSRQTPKRANFLTRLFGKRLRAPSIALQQQVRGLYIWRLD